MKAIKCPSCGSAIEIHEDEVDERIYICQYCGVHLRMKRGKAAIKARVRLKELEHDEAMLDKENQHELDMMDKEFEQEQERTTLSSGSVALIVALLLIVVIGTGLDAFTSSNPGFTPFSNQTQIAKSAGQMRNTDHTIIEAELKNAGLEDIESQPLGDKGGWFDIYTDGAIEYISINGNDDFEANSWFPRDAKVIIRYHSFPER